MPHRIFRSGRGNARTISDKPVSGNLLPGTAVFIAATSLVPAASASGGNLALLGDRDYWGLDMNAFTDTDPLYVPYTSGETGVAYVLEPGQEYLWAMAAGSYTTGQELTVGAAGRLVAATTGTSVVACFDQPSTSLAAGTLADVVIVPGRTKA